MRKPYFERRTLHGRHLIKKIGRQEDFMEHPPEETVCEVMESEYADQYIRIIVNALNKKFEEE